MSEITIQKLARDTDEETQSESISESSYEDSEEEEIIETEIYGIHQALPVEEGEPSWEEGSPKTAEEYLRRVRWESERCEQIKTSRIDPRKYDDRRTDYIKISEEEEEEEIGEENNMDNLLASYDWIMTVVKDFHKLRKKLDEYEITEYVDAEYAENPERNPFDWAPVDLATRRDFGLGILRNDAKIKLSLLEYMEPVDLQYTLKLHIHEFLKINKENLKILNRKRALVIYALLAKLQKPLSFEIVSYIRCLYKKCGRLRREIEDPKNENEKLSYLNLLAAISGAYFGQNKFLAGKIEFD